MWFTLSRNAMKLEKAATLANSPPYNRQNQYKLTLIKQFHKPAAKMIGYPCSKIENHTLASRLIRKYIGSFFFLFLRPHQILI
jgi:hypothetical protein